CKRIQPVVPPGFAEPQHALLRTIAANGALVIDRPCRIARLWHAEAHDLAPCTAREHALQRRLTRVDNQLAFAGHGADEMVELRLDGSDVGKDVGVVVFEIVENGGAWA